MKISSSLRSELVRTIPNLRAFALSLCKDKSKADDLVQDALTKAWANFHKFEEGTNLRAWVFTIMRNEFYSNWRRLRHEVEDPNGGFAAGMCTQAPQHGQMDLKDFRTALESLPHDQREALLLVGASGLSYEEAADVCGCPAGTVKSRVSRARSHLAKLMSLDEAGNFDPDPISATVVKATAVC